MKKLIKPLILAVLIAAVCGIFVVGALAVTAELDANAVADGNVYKVVNGTSEKYYDATTSISDILSETSSGSTIYLLRDVTEVTDKTLNASDQYVATPIRISKGIVFDLNGYIFTFEQRAKNCGFYINTTDTVTFRNGTVATVAHEDYNSGGATFAFSNISKAGANLVFDNVNSNVSSLVYSYSVDYTVTVNGGRHVINSAPKDMNTSGFISGQSNVTATVTGATIYTNDRPVLGSSSYKALSSSLSPKSTFVFENCNIFASSATNSLVGNANQYTNVYFNGCHLLGSITPSLNGSDSENSVAASTPSNFIIGDNTFFSSGSNVLASATIAEDAIVQSTDERVSVDGGSYEFDTVAGYIRAIWHDENGTVIKSVKIDSSVTSLSDIAPEHEAVGGINNGWYKIDGYIANAWSTTLNGVKEVDLSAINPASLTGSIDFYPLADGSKISPHLSAAMYNLSIVGAIHNNVYLPEAPDGVEVIGVYVGNRAVTGYDIIYHDYTAAPVPYTMYVINEVGATQFTRVTDVKVKYSLNGEIVLEQEYNISPQKYANIIYQDSQKTEGNSYNEKSYNVIADLVRYSYLLSKYTKIDNPELDSLYNKMSHLCSELPSSSSLNNYSSDLSELAGVGSIAYEASSYEPRWRFKINESAKIVDIRITLSGYYKSTQEDRTNFGIQTYGIENVSRNADGYITVAYSQNIPVYNIVNPFTVTLVKADGTELVGTYGLKSYYNAVGRDFNVKGDTPIVSVFDNDGLMNADSNEIGVFLKSVFSLANSITAYKFPEGKLTNQDICDFWECDHAGAEKQETISTYIYNFAPRFCAKCDSWLFYYEDYGAVADGQTNRTRSYHVTGTNDYEAIYWTHKNANEWKARTDLSLGKHVAVVGNSDPANAKYYYISLPEGRGIYTADTNYDGIPETTYTGKNLGSIVIATDTSWNGVNLIIDDDTICNASGCSCVNALGVSRKHAYNSQSIFVIDEYGSEKYTESLTGKITSLSAGATNIGYAPGRKMLVQLVDSNKKIYLRYGSNASNGADVTEVILVDEFGNIDPSTPLQWDYVTITKATAYAVDTDPIRISGLNGDSINATFESYVNNSLDISIPHYVSCGRNITINRSNATIEGIERFFTEEEANSNVTNKRFAYTFIATSLCSKVTIKDMLVINHNSQAGESGVGQGSYEFNGGSANAVSWINCVTKNMFSNSKTGALQAYPVYRGLFGTNHIRNMYLKDCYLNSFDAHTGAYNVTLEDTTVEHMNFIGGGKITIKNVTVYTSSQGMAFNLRTDYGSTWKGDIDIDGLTVMYANASSYKPSRITVLSGSYQNQYWGFDTYAPQNVTINNFHIQAYTATVSDGKRTETLGAKDDSNMKVYYYYALNSLTADQIPEESKAGIHGPEDKGDPDITYDYGTNHIELTKRLTITNSVNVIIPVGSAWKNMEVTVNGKTKIWSGGTSTGTWN